MTLRELYDLKKQEPSPAQAFIKKLSKATCRTETTVRQWLSGIQQPNDLVKKRIARTLNMEVTELFP